MIKKVLKNIRLAKGLCDGFSFFLVDVIVLCL